MTWAEKLEATRAALRRRPEMTMVFDEGGTGISEEFLNLLASRYPFLPAEYIDFLRITDGLQLDTFVLYGSGTSPFRSILAAAGSWMLVFQPPDFVPIGEDAGGGCFALNRKGEVWSFEQDPPDPTLSYKIADSFSEFLGEMLMGGRFLQLFGDNWKNLKENEWTRHLRREGWLQNGKEKVPGTD